MATLKPTIAGSGLASSSLVDLSTVLDEFTAAWERGEAPAAEDYLDHLDPADSHAAVDLIYREYCLAEAGGWKPEISHYLNRFPRHQAALERLIQLHGECSPSLLGRWMDTAPALEMLPRAGDAIGPFFLRRQLGEGGFARVFLAEQTDLENRLVVVKVSMSMTREPWLLARVRHAHIVEIVSHATVDDGAFHLICMPFWGGATLATILARLRATGRRPLSGNDLLAALDFVAAPEFPTIHAPRPAREILAGLTYSQAVAWLGARLAEALDYAATRDVAHGDVKPSNILLSADGNPLLLDFNLARDGSPAGLRRSAHDPGGTLAYMAPERLDGIATFDPPRARPNSVQREAGLELDSAANLDCHSRSLAGPGDGQPVTGPHLADIYSLGMLLLEAVTGQPSVPVAASSDSAPSTDLGRLKANANAYKLSRTGGATAAIRESEHDGWGRVTPGLRAILERCLDPDPAARYRRSLELAEDLDRWRADRPLVYTSESLWRQIVPRLVRRQRRPLVTAGISLLVILATTTVALLKSDQTLQSLGLFKLARLWDDPEARAFRFQRTIAPRLLQADLSHVEIALRGLTEYGVIGPDDWRRRDDVRTLPTADRDDLELWLMEQAYLYCRGLADRPNSPQDWRRALKILDRVVETAPIPAFATLRHRLSAGTRAVGSGSPSVTTGPSASREPSWVNEYLLGVVAECEPETDEPGPFMTVEAVSATGSNRSAVGRDAIARTRLAAERALCHYNNFLESHPESFWANYRAASAAYALGEPARIAEAADHLEQCLKRRPINPTLHHHRSACLLALDRLHEAQEEVDVAITEAPDLAEFYRTRVTIRANLKQTGGLGEDLEHFELLSRLLPHRFWGEQAADSDPSPGSAAPRALPFAATFELGARLSDRPAEPEAGERIAVADPRELDARIALAGAIRQAGEPDLAEAELGKVLLLDREHIGARMTRATQAIAAGRLDDALPDLERVLAHPGIVEYVRREPLILARMHDPNHRSLLGILLDASRLYCRDGKIDEGRKLARSALDLAIATGQFRGNFHYNLARAYADSAPINPKYVGKAAYQLFRAFVASPVYKNRYLQDSTFDADRVRIDALLKRKPDPSDEYRRRLAAMSPAQVP